MKIPFDSLNLAAVLSELRPFTGSKVQKISQPEPHTVVVEFFGNQGRAHLLLSCDPVFARMHLVTRKPGNPLPIPTLCAAMRAHLDGAQVTSFRQRGFDRIAEIVFEGPEGSHVLIAELMGKHSNLIFLGPDGHVLACAKVVGPSKSVRPMLPGRPYRPPPFAPKKSILDAEEGDDLAGMEGASPFLLRLVEARAAIQGVGVHIVLNQIAETVAASAFSPVVSLGSGAYPIPVAALGLEGHERSSISVALEQHYAQAIPSFYAEQLRTSLTTQLRRVLLARETALSDLRQAADAARNAGGVQMKAELILAYGPTLVPGARVLETEDYSGHPIKIELDPELGYLDNAKKLFEKAKRAKAGSATVADQMQRLSADKAALEAALAALADERPLLEVEAVRDAARKKRWLHEQPAAKSGQRDVLWAGHKIRELRGPRDFRVLYGENATSNDYLTTRVAKPNDIWLHVRGSASAHVVVATDNHPERVGKDVLEFAARVAVQNSVAKHSSYVPVDYTLKKHVRKPKGSAAGFAVYTQEKTLHVEPGGS